MANPPLILTPFANAGDQSVLPASDPNGFVNFNTGYTPDYEINLGSGDPQAKAVERGVQNYLFNILTSGMQSWQVNNRPPWYSGMPGGYSQWAEVMYPTDGSATPKPYRSLVSANFAAPTDATKWEYIQGTGEMIKNVPMPSGGAAGPGSMLVTGATDFNTFTVSGTYQFASDAVVSGSPNAPVNGGIAGAAGVLEVMQFMSGSTSVITQFFRDRNGIGFMRGSTGGSWTVWKIWANAHQFTIGEIRMWSGTATEAAVAAAWGPGWHLCNGLNGTPYLLDKFIIAAGGGQATGGTGGSLTNALSVANLPAHNHVINIIDPGHAHGVSQTPHGHSVIDPGHAHGVYDPGHTHAYQINTTTGGQSGYQLSNSGPSNFTTGASATGIQIYGNGTGVTIQAQYANVGINSSGTGVTATSNNTGSGAAFSIVPPFYALAFVMYTGA